MNIHIQSFGYKYGIPTDSDLMFDVRFIPNPYYIEKLRDMNGYDEEVKDYVLSQKESKDFYSKLLPLIEFLIPQYIKEGKKHLTISIGCSGGQHRSVTFVNKLAEDLKNRPAQSFKTVSNKYDRILSLAPCSARFNLSKIELFMASS